MYLVIEKREWETMDDRFNVVFNSKERELANRFAQCKIDEVNEQGKENYYYDVVNFTNGYYLGTDLVHNRDEYNKSLTDNYIKDVKN